MLCLNYFQSNPPVHTYPLQGGWTWPQLWPCNFYLQVQLYCARVHVKLSTLQRSQQHDVGSSNWILWDRLRVHSTAGGRGRAGRAIEECVCGMPCVLVHCGPALPRSCPPQLALDCISVDQLLAIALAGG